MRSCTGRWYPRGGGGVRIWALPRSPRRRRIDQAHFATVSGHAEILDRRKPRRDDPSRHTNRRRSHAEVSVPRELHGGRREGFALRRRIWPDGGGGEALGGAWRKARVLLLRLRGRRRRGDPRTP